MVLVLASRGLSLVHTCDISISINAGISIRMCSVNRCDISISISIRKRELFLFLMLMLMFMLMLMSQV